MSWFRDLCFFLYFQRFIMFPNDFTRIFFLSTQWFTKPSNSAVLKKCESGSFIIESTYLLYLSLKRESLQVMRSDKFKKARSEVAYFVFNLFFIMSHRFRFPLTRICASVYSKFKFQIRVNSLGCMCVAVCVSEWRIYWPVRLGW